MIEYQDELGQLLEPPKQAAPTVSVPKLPPLVAVQTPSDNLNSIPDGFYAVESNASVPEDIGSLVPEGFDIVPAQGGIDAVQGAPANDLGAIPEGFDLVTAPTPEQLLQQKISEPKAPTTLWQDQSERGLQFQSYIRQNPIDKDKMSASYRNGEPFDVAQASIAKKAEESATSPWYRRAIADPLLGVAGGVIDVGGAALGLLDLVSGGYAGKGYAAIGGDIPATKAFIASGLSPETRKALKSVEESKGFLPTIKAGFENPSAIVQSIAESVPSMLGGGAAARAILPRLLPKVLAQKVATKAALSAAEQAIVSAASATASGIGEGIIAAGSAAEQYRQSNPSGLLNAGQSGLAIANGALTALFGIGGGKLARRLKLEDIDSLAAGLSDPTGKAATGLALRLIGGAVTEGMVEELPQSISDAIASNLATGRPWDENLGNNAAVGTLAGALMGSVAQVRGKKPAITETPEDVVAAPETPQLPQEHTAFINDVSEKILDPNGAQLTPTEAQQAVQKAIDLGLIGKVDTTDMTEKDVARIFLGEERFKAWETGAGAQRATTAAEADAAAQSMANEQYKATLEEDRAKMKQFYQSKVEQLITNGSDPKTARAMAAADARQTLRALAREQGLSDTESEARIKAVGSKVWGKHVDEPTDLTFLTTENIRQQQLGAERTTKAAEDTRINKIVETESLRIKEANQSKIKDLVQRGVKPDSARRMVAAQTRQELRNTLASQGVTDVESVLKKKMMGTLGGYSNQAQDTAFIQTESIRHEQAFAAKAEADRIAAEKAAKLEQMKAEKAAKIQQAKDQKAAAIQQAQTAKAESLRKAQEEKAAVDAEKVNIGNYKEQARSQLITAYGKPKTWTDRSRIESQVQAEVRKHLRDTWRNAGVSDDIINARIDKISGRIGPIRSEAADTSYLAKAASRVKITPVAKPQPQVQAPAQQAPAPASQAAQPTQATQAGAQATAQQQPAAPQPPVAAAGVTTPTTTITQEQPNAIQEQGAGEVGVRNAPEIRQGVGLENQPKETAGVQGAEGIGPKVQEVVPPAQAAPTTSQTQGQARQESVTAGGRVTQDSVRKDNISFASKVAGAVVDGDVVRFQNGTRIEHIFDPNIEATGQIERITENGKFAGWKVAINPNAAVQSTAPHERAHAAWDMLNDSEQSLLKKAYGIKADENVAVALGKAAVSGMKPAPQFEKNSIFSRAWRKFQGVLSALTGYRWKPDFMKAEEVVGAMQRGEVFGREAPRSVADIRRLETERKIDVDRIPRPMTDSTGKRIQPTDEGIRNFWRWFGDSHVTERAVSSKQKRETLRPQVVYHGTRKNFDTFAPVREGNVVTMFGEEDAVVRRGIFFAENPDFAATFARQSGEGSPTMMPVYLKIENPLYLDEGFTEEIISELRGAGLPDEQAQRLRYRKADMAWAEFDDEAGEAFVSAARAAGYDGVMMVEPGVGVENEEQQTVWVAFDPNQIKSAIGNSGEFDPNNPDIRYEKKIYAKDVVQRIPKTHAEFVKEALPSDKTELFDAYVKERASNPNLTLEDFYNKSSWRADKLKREGYVGDDVAAENIYKSLKPQPRGNQAQQEKTSSKVKNGIKSALLHGGLNLDGIAGYISPTLRKFIKPMLDTAAERFAKTSLEVEDVWSAPEIQRAQKAMIRASSGHIRSNFNGLAKGTVVTSRDQEFLFYAMLRDPDMLRQLSHIRGKDGETMILGRDASENLLKLRFNKTLPESMRAYDMEKRLAAARDAYFSKDSGGFSSQDKKALADGMQKVFNDILYPKMNETYKNQYSEDLKKVDYYLKMMAEPETVYIGRKPSTTVAMEMREASQFVGRVGVHDRPYRLLGWQDHVAGPMSQNARVAAYGDIYQKILDTLVTPVSNGRTLIDSINKTHGQEVSDALRRSILAAQGVSDFFGSKRIGNLAGLFAKSKLSGINTMLTQIAQAPSTMMYAFDLPAAMAGMLELRRALPMMFDAFASKVVGRHVKLPDRFRRYADASPRYAFRFNETRGQDELSSAAKTIRRPISKTLNWIGDVAMSGTSALDRLSLLMLTTSAENYAKRTLGINQSSPTWDRTIADLVMSATDDFQPMSRPELRTTFSNANSAGRMLNLFASAKNATFSTLVRDWNLAKQADNPQEAKRIYVKSATAAITAQLLTFSMLAMGMAKLRAKAGAEDKDEETRKRSRERLRSLEMKPIENMVSDSIMTLVKMAPGPAGSVGEIITKPIVDAYIRDLDGSRLSLGDAIKIVPGANDVRMTWKNIEESVKAANVDNYDKAWDKMMDAFASGGSIVAPVGLARDVFETIPKAMSNQE